ncbi:MAG: hypothetical protein ABIB93_03680 [Chloroflexota bacterium]
MMIRAFKSFLNERKGQALIGVLVLLVAGGITVTPFLYLASISIKYVQIAGDRLCEFYGADAGIEYGLWKIVTEVTPNGLHDVYAAEGEINGRVVTVYISGSNPDFTIEAASVRSGENPYQLTADVTRSGASPPYTILTISGWN